MSFNLPLALHQRGIYYGYIALAVGTLGIIASLPGQTMGISVYTDHLVQAYGIDRLSLSILYMAGTLTSAFILPLAGRILDRFGARFLATLACVGLALSLLLLAAGPTIVQIITNLTGASHSWTSMAMMYLCFFGARHFGQGQLTIASRTMMGRWFLKKRGLMLGISGVFVAFGFGITPFFINHLIEILTWKISLAVIACGLVCIGLIALAFFRESPEAHGLMIDGGLVSQQALAQAPPKEISFTVQQVKKSLTFWVFNFGVSIYALFITGIAFNMADLGLQHGLSSTESFQVFIYVSFVAVVSDVIAGYLSDRIPLRYLLAFLQAALILALCGFQSFGTPLGYSCIILGLGTASGFYSLLTAAAWPKLFGREHLGSINGLVTAWMVGASALGPYIFNQGKAITGDYTTVIWLSLIVPAVMFVLAFFARTPQPRPVSHHRQC